MNDEADLQRDATPTLTGPRARAVLAAVVARLTDKDAIALCELMLSWYPERQEHTAGHVIPPPGHV